MKHLGFFIYLALLFFVISCATVVSPTGGPKDIEPPKIKTSSLENHKTSFHKKSIKITFNEFFTLNNPTESIIFSPPLQVTPDFLVRNKSLLINFKDSLQDNTTYNIVFSNAIKDYTEGNLLPLLSYEFSTAPYMDSLSFCGEVRNALTDVPESNVNVFLYQNLADSVLKTERPYYVTKTDQKGNFVFSFLKTGQYKITALLDKNNNLIYDLPNEMIAFEHNLITPYYIPTDSTLMDSAKNLIHQNLVSLKLFQEQDSLQSFIKKTNPINGIYQFIYRNKVQHLDLHLLKGKFPDYFMSYNPTRDTITCFLKDIYTDTASIELIADSQQIDTVELTPHKQLKSNSRQKKAPVLNVGLRPCNYGFEPLFLTFSYPVKPSEIYFTLKKNTQTDTTYSEHQIQIADSLTTQLEISLDLEEGTAYELFFRDSLFKGYNQLCNDSLFFNFVTKRERDFGNLILNLNVEDNLQYIVQLLSNHHIVHEDFFTTNQKVVQFKRLLPGNYQIRLIKDLNQNKIWDTGDYDQKIQPEPSSLYHKTISIRANWDLEETLKPF